MTYTATITSKRQLTIPAEIFRKIGLKEGQKVILEEDDGTIRMTSALSLVRSLSGSVKLPSRFHDLSLDEIIEKAKNEHISDQT